MLVCKHQSRQKPEEQGRASVGGHTDEDSAPGALDEEGATDVGMGEWTCQELWAASQPRFPNTYYSDSPGVRALLRCARRQSSPRYCTETSLGAIMISHMTSHSLPALSSPLPFLPSIPPFLSLSSLPPSLPSLFHYPPSHGRFAERGDNDWQSSTTNQ